MAVLEQTYAHGHGIDNGLLFGVGLAQRFGQLGELVGPLVHQFGQVIAQTLQFLSGALTLGDVARNTQHTDDLALAVKHGALDGFEQARFVTARRR